MPTSYIVVISCVSGVPGSDGNIRWNSLNPTQLKHSNTHTRYMRLSGARVQVMRYEICVFLAPMFR